MVVNLSNVTTVIVCGALVDAVMHRAEAQVSVVALSEPEAVAEVPLVAA